MFRDTWSYLIGTKAIKDGIKGESTCIYCHFVQCFFDVEVEGYDMAHNDNDEKTFHLGPMSAPILYVLGYCPLSLVTTRMNS